MTRLSNARRKKSPSRSEDDDSPALTARSVLLSVLLGTDPPRLPVQLLVRTGELFGLAGGATRTALSRMREAGEVTAQDGWYEITSSRLLARQARQSASREAVTGSWDDGSWIQALVAAEGRRAPAARAALRAALAGARLGELREGVWLRPDNLGSWPVLPDDLGHDVLWLRSVPEQQTPAALAERLWDLSGWADRAEELITRMEDLIDPLQRHDRRVLAAGFILSAAVLRHFQADPLLPAAILPAAWPGERLRELYDTYDRAYRAVLLEWFTEQG